MTKTLNIALSALALSFTLMSTPVLAEEEVDAAIVEKLTAQLVAEGYDVRKIEGEDGLIEAYVVKDGEATKLFFDADLNPVEDAGADADE